MQIIERVRAAIAAARAPSQNELTVDRDGVVVRIEGRVEWRVYLTDHGNHVGICDSLKLTLQTKTHLEMLAEIAEATNLLFADLCEEGDLDRFLADRGWNIAVGDQPRPDAVFDIPVSVLLDSAPHAAPAIAAG